MFLELRWNSNYYYVYKYTRSILFAGKEAILYLQQNLLKRAKRI